MRMEKDGGLQCHVVESTFSCEPGHYLDLDSQHCRPCNPGFFSLGGGIRYEEFVTLPSGFSVDNMDSNPNTQFLSQQSQVVECPKEAGWVVKDGELIYIPTPPACARCQVDTVPNYGLQYQNWEVMSPKLSSRCEYISEGLTSKDGVTCTAIGKIQLDSGGKDNNETKFTYDFGQFVGRSWNISGVRVFSREGYTYYPFLIVALFPPNVKCQEQYDNFDMIGILDQDKEAVEGLAC
ncbi:hypothetical protein CRE_22064 [Caenorhabditis remanei]|uniref:Elapor1-like galactose binding domain-containing protein n=1 Tax=Caenorhabditis remanei TaxID=31234 RepID=E3N8T9_CAERE|nr:hypothetical protein CRE_22064 [Caenorhabditis remanei]